ncbi:hypothetical protein DRF62_15825 [Chryseobacterium piscium]|uniref:Secretion system C-terminal sorting domain-containing protein n=1 Tax=Chryseobacterium piscium TaxID=333702 RepID=A0A3D9BFE8_9FLAO|nr:T9SS type A sorting domain-containing protein [Chryseobacterium piscium]REC52249.1 hypothetical protein DRF62_15825 [Chryseobacterium piscium]
MKKFFLIASLLLFFLGYSQGENNNWYFGGKAAVNYSIQGSPAPLLNSNMQVGLQPVGSISDNNGKLLFYSDGKYVWNREHQIMQSGVLNTGSGSYGIQLAILKHPNNSNLYYIFTPVPKFYNNGIVSNGISCYTVIDMSLGGISSNDGLPLGDVLPNHNSIPLVGENELPFAAANINVVKHSDNNSFWVVIPNKTKLYSYLVNNQGFVNSPIVSSMPLNIPSYSPSSHPSYLKTSPSVNVSSNFSNYLYISHWGAVNPTNWGSTKVLSFNNTTGQITTDFVLDISTNPSGSSTAEFTDDGSILYIGGNGSSNIYGIDMINIASPPNYYLLPINYSSSSSGPTDMQRNRYGDIYMPFEYSNGYLAKIINQNGFNNGSVDINDLYLQGRNTTRNLPQLVQSKSITGDCFQDLLLTGIEPNSAFIHRASNSIKTQTDYLVNSNQNIEMKAGSYILLSPNTTINGEFFAKIEDCATNSGNSKSSNNPIFEKPIKLSLDLRTNSNLIANKIKLTPNPTIDILNIKTDSKINSVSVVDITGKKVNVKLDGDKVDVRSLPAGTYLINVETKDGISTEKFIKK